MKRVLVLCAAAASLVAGACGGGGSERQDSSETPTTSPSTTAPGGGSATTTTAPAGGQAQSGKATTTTTTASAPGGQATTTVPPEYRLDIAMKESCVTPGQAVSFTVTRTDPRSVVAWTMQYGDGRAHGNSGGGPADGKGAYQGQFAVAVDAPAGHARLAVAGQKNGHNALGSVIVRVEAPGGC